MSKLDKQSLVKFLQTEAGEDALRETRKVVYEQIISAAKYYMGKPDGKYFEASKFDENVVKAKKAYVTLNTLMGGETSERDRFNEGKKQTPELLTPYGVKKMINLFSHLFLFASMDNSNIDYQTIRACRQSEVPEGESIVEALTSTTKLSVDEIIKLGYGNKNNLAICYYKFHDKVAVFDMERLGKDYLKPEEREVLLLMGNRIVAHRLGYDEHYLGRDSQPAIIYNIDVYPPEFSHTLKNHEEIEKVVYNSKYISEVRKFYEALNYASEYPDVPVCYKEWKSNFKKLVFLEISKIW